jgi:aminopeptidase N
MAVVAPDVTEPLEKLSPVVYQKGAWVLHMLRRRIGDEHFFEGMRAFYRQNADGNATTADLQRLIEDRSGDSLGPFFRQWLLRADFPDLEVTWGWDETTGEVVVEVEQVQGGEPYRVPLELALHVPGAVERRTMALTAARQVARLPLPGAPSTVEVDPDGWLLHRATVAPR